MPTPDLQLAPAHLELLRELLARHVPDAGVWAYGSRVNGDAHAGSDLDLVLRLPGDTPGGRGGIAGLREALQQSVLPFLVDVHDWSSLPPAFHHEIERADRVIQAPAGRSASSPCRE
jgi:predicted nucleotidyltransferase